MPNPERVAPPQVRLMAKLLEMAADEFSNHGCNDVEQSIYEECGFSDADKATLIHEMQQWNGDTKDPHPTKLMHIQDWMLMRFFAAKASGEF